MTRIKISGVTQPADAALAAELGADIVACVFNAQSPRYVTIRQAWSIRRALPGDVALCGVFVDTPAPVVQMVAQSCQLNYIQLFGSEPRAEADALGAIAFKAVTVNQPDELEQAVRTYVGRWQRRSDEPGLLLHLSGVVGAAWDLATSPANRVPLILAASSLGPDSVAAALAASTPWAVDVWDAVESEPGRLDPVRLAEFIQATRDADSDQARSSAKEATS